MQVGRAGITSEDQPSPAGGRDKWRKGVSSRPPSKKVKKNMYDVKVTKTSNKERKCLYKLATNATKPFPSKNKQETKQKTLEKIKIN